MIAINVMRMLGLLGKVDPESGNVHEETLKEAHCAGKRDDEPCGKKDCPVCGKNREDKSLEESDKDPEKPHDDGDEHDERCDYIDCEGKEKDQIEEYAMSPLSSSKGLTRRPPSCRPPTRSAESRFVRSAFTVGPASGSSFSSLSSFSSFGAMAYSSI